MRAAPTSEPVSKVRVHVGFAQAVMRRIELGDHRFGMAVQRIEIGDTHAEKAIRVDELQHVDLLALQIGFHACAGPAVAFGKAAKAR